MTFEIEVELQDAFVELRLEAVTFLDLPLPINYRKRYVFIRSARMEPYSHSVSSTVRLQEELGRSSLVKQLWVKDVEFIPLYNLWRRILAIVMRLVVLIPFIPLFDRVEEPRFAPYLFRDLISPIFTEEFALFCSNDI